jgi:hypothetical protein
MQWIIDLLIDKLKKDKTKEWEPEPLWIEDEFPVKDNEKDKKEDQKVIILDL